MPPKRKAVDAVDAPETNRRHTRSSGPVQPLPKDEPPKRKRGRPPGRRTTESPAKPDVQASARKTRTTSAKRSRTNRRNEDEREEDDELNISPNRNAPRSVATPPPRAPSTPGPSVTGTPRRMVMEAVEITTPRSLRTVIGRPTSRADSPDPLKARQQDAEENHLKRKTSSGKESSEKVSPSKTTRSTARKAAQDDADEEAEALPKTPANQNTSPIKPGRRSRRLSSKHAEPEIDEDIRPIQSLRFETPTQGSSKKASPKKSTATRQVARTENALESSPQAPSVLGSSPSKTPRPLFRELEEEDVDDDEIGLQSGQPQELDDNDEIQFLMSSASRARRAVSPPSKHVRIADTDEHPSSPSKAKPRPDASPVRALPRSIPSHLRHFFELQRRAVLKSLLSPSPPASSSADETNANARKTLKNLILGTLERGEGNSCLVLGPRGSGKTRLVEQVLADLPSEPIVIRLSAHSQTTDRLAMREIARYLTVQNGSTFVLPETEEDMEVDDGAIAPPAAHLPTLISHLPSLARPTVVVLDAFDLFASHPRQALLYCLLDTVQSCRAGEGQKGLIVIGVSTRVDCLTLLEKRVKSRFSHRIIQVINPTNLKDYIEIARNTLCPPLEEEGPEADEWNALWRSNVDRFLADKSVNIALRETFGLARDMRNLSRILTTPILDLSVSSPWLYADLLRTSVKEQRPPRFPFLSTLPYPALILLIAAQHTITAGHDTFTFALLDDTFRARTRHIQMLRMTVDGQSLKMIGVTRPVLLAAYEYLITTKVFQPVAGTAATASMPKEYAKYRCVAELDEVRGAVEKNGSTNLRSWLLKP